MLELFPFSSPEAAVHFTGGLLNLQLAPADRTSAVSDSIFCVHKVSLHRSVANAIPCGLAGLLFTNEPTIVASAMKVFQFPPPQRIVFGDWKELPAIVAGGTPPRAVIYPEVWKTAPVGPN